MCVRKNVERGVCVYRLGVTWGDWGVFGLGGGGNPVGSVF